MVVLVLFLVVPDWQDNTKLIIKSAKNNFIFDDLIFKCIMLS